MNQTKILLIASFMAFTGAAFASPKSAQGVSKLKLSDDSDSGDSIRETRKALAAVEKELANLDQEITRARSQALINRSTPAANPMTSAAFEALANSIELQKTDLVARRNSLRTDLQYQSN